MAGPVWRFDRESHGTCDVCLREIRGLFVEGEVEANELAPVRRVCEECLSRWRPLVVKGEVGRRVPGPAYAHND